MTVVSIAGVLGGKMIKTEQEYEQAMTKIESLMDAVPGTPEFKWLEKLVGEVEAYEDIHYPIGEPS